MKKIYVSILAAALATLPAWAQDNLQKEITLPKDFVPVVKKPVKKSSLPRVLKPVKSNEGAEISFTDWAEPTAVSVEIPTMLPYGYRTAHRFSNQRGYFDAGAGTQLNFVGSAGYRIVDAPTLKVDAWAQHNSTWNGKNTSPALEKVKQQFCDNALGVDVAKAFDKGTLNVAGKVHFDKFNYYAQPTIDGVDQSRLWWHDKQNFFEAYVKGAWTGSVDVSRYHDISYKVGVNYNYAGYKNGFAPLNFFVYDDFDGAKEHHLQAMLGAKYAIEASSSVGADFKFDLLSRTHKELVDFDIAEKVKQNSSMFTISPFYTYNGQNLMARLGVNVNLSFSDGTKFRLAPNVQLTYEFTPGVAFFANAEGGKQLNTLSRLAAINRYLDPNGRYGNTFVPLDAEAGLKVGPFTGLTVKLFGGYGITKDALMYTPSMLIATGQLLNLDCKGLKAGAAVNYQYRQVAELDARFTFAPQSDDFETGKSYSGYMLGLDHAKMVANADLKVHPIKALTVGVGMEYRNGRRYLSPTANSVIDGAPEYEYLFVDMNDVLNLHAGASYRFDKYLIIWVKAANLLNKQWDVLAGMGAQKLNVMGGIGFVF